MRSRSVDVGDRFDMLKAIVRLPGKTLRGSPAWLCKCECNSFIIASESVLTGGRRQSCGCAGGGFPMVRITPKQKINMLTLISYMGKLDEDGEPIWLCKCECGEFTEAPLKRILRSLTRDCGCVHIKQMKAREKDITDCWFGNLKAISPTGKKTKNQSIWLCECDCGNFPEVAIGDLTSGGTVSCGCYVNALRTSEADGMHHQDGTNMGVILTRKPPKNSSGIRGVTFRPKSGKWLASMVFQKKTVLYKECDAFEEAVQARKEAEEKYHRPAIERYEAFHKKASGGIVKPKLRKQGAISGVPGVTYNRQKGKWRARLIYQQKTVLDKVFDFLEDAISVRREAEKIYLGYEVKI